MYTAPPGHASAILDDVELSPFRIERFYARYEHSTRFMLSSSDCESRTIGALLELEPDAHGRLLETWCGYTESPGGPGLRQAIASLYERTGAEEVVATSCAEEGIFLLYHALLRPGDHVIVETPCYESALQVARSTGAEVSQWRRRYEDGWAHDLDALAGLIRPATRLLYLNQPHNPTGTLMPRPVFEHVIELARAHGLVVFSDEVYRELEHDPADRLPAACDEYERAVSLGSISKSYGLPGLRTGWIATRDAGLRDAVLTLKDYTTICASDRHDGGGKIRGQRVRVGEVPGARTSFIGTRRTLPAGTVPDVGCMRPPDSAGPLHADPRLRSRACRQGRIRAGFEQGASHIGDAGDV